MSKATHAGPWTRLGTRVHATGTNHAAGTWIGPGPSIVSGGGGSGAMLRRPIGGDWNRQRGNWERIDTEDSAIRAMNCARMHHMTHPTPFFGKCVVASSLQSIPARSSNDVVWFLTSESIWYASDESFERQRSGGTVPFGNPPSPLRCVAASTITNSAPAHLLLFP